MTLEIQSRQHEVTVAITSPVFDYVIDVDGEPAGDGFTITGPGRGIRIRREGSHDFHSFGELIKSIVTPGMTDLEKAMAVYRFSGRCFHSASAGWGDTEMTRFINCRGYSFCWGQGDFQQLLYEAAGLQARAPVLKGHSSVEVLIDGKWRMMDAFMRLLVPSRDLTGIATGEEVHQHPEMFDAVRDKQRAATARDWWSIWEAGGTYEPWQDSRAMTLNLRRGESLQLHPYGSAWCLAASEPSDHVTGTLTWQPKFDEAFLKTEAEASSNLKVEGGALVAVDPSQPASLTIGARLPYPIAAGNVEVGLDDQSGVTVEASNNLSNWHELAIDEAKCSHVDLADHVSPRMLPDTWSGQQITAAEVRSVFVRLTWTGDTVVHRVALDLNTQHHRPAVPSCESGTNRWRVIGGEQGASITHRWTTWPTMSVSHREPFVGDDVTLSCDVHNTGDAPACDVTVVFMQARRFGEPIELARATIDTIASGASAAAVADWTAAIHADRGACRRDEGELKTYVGTRIIAVVDGEADLKGANHVLPDGVSAVQLRVRPRPRPIFSKQLTRRSIEQNDEGDRLIVRAAVIHPPHDEDGEVAYMQPTELIGTLTLFDGHPDDGGTRIGDPHAIGGVYESEFGLATWTLDPSLASSPDLHIEALFDPPAHEACRRQIARVADGDAFPDPK